MDVYTILAINLKLIRIAMKESQEEFAFHCGISLETLSKLERGCGNPRLSTLISIAAYVGCEPAIWLMKKKLKDERKFLKCK